MENFKRMEKEESSKIIQCGKEMINNAIQLFKEKGFSIQYMDTDSVIIPKEPDLLPHHKLEKTEKP